MTYKILILLVFAGMVPAAFAETYNDSVSFPIPDNIAEIMKRCGIDKMDDAELIVTCQWKFTAEQIQSWYEQIITEQGLTDPELEPTEQTDAPAPIDSAPDYSPTPYERDLAYFTENEPRSNADKEYFELLKHLGECQRGYNQSRGIQDNEWYQISHTWINDGEAWLKSIDLDGRHGKLRMAIEECIAQRTILNPVILGVEALHKGQYFGVNQPNHQDMAITDSWESIPLPDKLTVRDFNDAKERAEKLCTLPSDYHCRLAEMKEQSYRDDQSVMVQYPSKILERFQQYKLDGGDSMYKELVRESMQEALSRALERYQ